MNEGYKSLWGISICIREWNHMNDGANFNLWLFKSIVFSPSLLEKGPLNVHTIVRHTWWNLSFKEAPVSFLVIPVHWNLYQVCQEAERKLYFTAAYRFCYAGRESFYFFHNRLKGKFSFFGCLSIRRGQRGNLQDKDRQQNPVDWGPLCYVCVLSEGLYLIKEIC